MQTKNPGSHPPGDPGFLSSKDSATGNRIPESAPKVGRTFPTDPQPETTSHSNVRFRDALSANKEGHTTWPSTHLYLYMLQILPRQATSQQQGVCPAARNVRFIASSARAGEHLMCSPCEQDCPSRQPYASRTVPAQLIVTTAQYRRASPSARQSQCRRTQ